MRLLRIEQEPRCQASKINACGRKKDSAKRGDSFKNHTVRGDGNDRPPTPFETMMGNRLPKETWTQGGSHCVTAAMAVQ